MQTDDSPALRTLLRTLRKLALALPGAEEYVMVHHPAFRVGKKPFAIAGIEDNTKGATVSVNLGVDAQQQLLDDARFAKTPYIGQHGWVTITRAAVGDAELTALLHESYRRIANAKQRAALAGPSPAAKSGSKAKPAKKKKRAR